jgi:hypothetical protein
LLVFAGDGTWILDQKIDVLSQVQECRSNK